MSILQVNSIRKDDPNWLLLTTERFRIDEHVLDALSSSQAVKEKGKDIVATLLTRCDTWIRQVLFNRRSAAPLRVTNHLLERAREYEGKLSRCGTFIELYANERHVIETLENSVSPGTALKRELQYKIVEIGLNKYGNVCKLALLLPFAQWFGDDEREKNRKLFLLIGCDGGLKTFYAVDGLKWRDNYQMDSLISALSVPSLYRLEETLALEQRQKKDTVLANGKDVKQKESDGEWTIVKSRRQK